RLTQPQCVEQRPANPPVYDQPISAFKSRDGATGSRSDDSIDHAVIITEFPKATLHGCDQRGVIAVSRGVVRVVVVVGAVRITAQIGVRVISPGSSVTQIGIRPARVIAIVRVSRSAARVVAGTTVISVTAVVSRRTIVPCAAVLAASVRTGASIGGSRII